MHTYNKKLNKKFTILCLQSLMLYESVVLRHNAAMPINMRAQLQSPTEKQRRISGQFKWTCSNMQFTPVQAVSITMCMQSFILKHYIQSDVLINNGFTIL